MAKGKTKYIDEITSVEDASKRRRRHKRGMKGGKLGARERKREDTEL
jgi:hypothetical protein